MVIGKTIVLVIGVFTVVLLSSSCDEAFDEFDRCAVCGVDTRVTVTEEMYDLALLWPRDGGDDAPSAGLATRVDIVKAEGEAVSAA